MSEATPRTQIRRVENVKAFPLVSLRAAQALREWLDGKEAEGLRRAREMGASLEDIADALGITRQGVSYKLQALSERDEPAEPDVIIDVREADDETSASTPAGSEPNAPSG